LGDLAQELRAELVEPRDVAKLLGLEASREERQKWKCPRQGGTSLSLRVGRDGTLQVRCFGCDLAGDVFDLVAEVASLSTRADFPALLRRTAELFGRWDLVDAIERPERLRAPLPQRRRLVVPTVEPEYPPPGELASLLAATIDIAGDAEARSMFEGRGLDVERIDDLSLVRVLPTDSRVPAWAVAWLTTGHRALVPVVDKSGEVRSVRAWRVCDGDTPKRVAPRGFQATGLVFACPFARALLAGAQLHEPRVVIAEGEPDALVWATTFSDADEDAPVVLGVVAGSWTHALAARIPLGAHVVIRTHHDAAGNRYADQIGRSLLGRCEVARSRPFTEST
jgi:hypothetical protein